MRRTRLRRKINLDNDVSASSPNMLLISSIETPRAMRRRSMGTPSLSSIPNTPINVDSPNRTLNETFSPEPEEKVFSVRTLIDSVKKHKRHTASSVIDKNQFDTPRVTRGTLNSAKKSRTSIKKAAKQSPVFANIKEIVSKNINTTFLETVGQVADVVAGETKVIKSIRKLRRSSTLNTTLASEKKNVKFHSPANMEMSTFDIDVKMQSDRKVLRSMRSLSNAETDKAKNKFILTPEKVEKTKTPGSRKKMPNFSEIHQRQFERMESITEHAARKAERAKILSRSPKINIKSETVNIHETETVVLPKEEPEIVPEIVEELEPQIRSESEVVVKQETEFATAQELKPEVVQEPETIIQLNPVFEAVQEPILVIEQEPMLFNEPEPLDMDDLNLQSGTSSLSTSPFLQTQIPVSMSNITSLTEIEKRRASSLIGRSPFAIQIQDSISLPPKSPGINKRPIAISRIPGKIKLSDKKQTIPFSRLKPTKQDLNASTITKIPQPKFNSSVLIPSNKSNAPSNLNTSNVFVFKANKAVPIKSVTSAPVLSQNKSNLKRTASMMAMKPSRAPAPIPVRPAKENHVDKVKERQQKNMSLYKGRPDPDVKPRPTTAPKNMIVVRTNKRFELQMKFRQMNEKN